MNVPDGAYGFVYITTNNLNGRMYVGQKKIDDWGVWKNYLGSGKAFKQAVKKYGKENFEREVLDFAYSPEDLNSMEAEYILDLDCVSDPQYYNLVEGGGTVTGMIHSDATREKLRVRMLGENNYFYGKHFHGESNPFYGKHHSQAARLKMSASRKGMPSWSKGKTGIFSEESLDKMRSAKLGVPLSKEHIEAIRRSQSGEKHPMYGKKHSERTKDIIREKAKGRVASEETKRKMSASQRSRFSNPKNKIKHPTISVTCITTGITFKSIKEAAEFYNIKSPSTISSACKGTRKSAGKLPEGTCLKWKYCDEKTPR